MPNALEPTELLDDLYAFVSGVSLDKIASRRGLTSETVKGRIKRIVKELSGRAGRGYPYPDDRYDEPTIRGWPDPYDIRHIRAARHAIKDFLDGRGQRTIEWEWEYVEVEPWPDSTARRANYLGGSGWELVGPTAHGLTFKRRRPARRTPQDLGYDWKPPADVDPAV